MSKKSNKKESFKKEISKQKSSKKKSSKKESSKKKSSKKESSKKKSSKKESSKKMSSKGKTTKNKTKYKSGEINSIKNILKKTKNNTEKKYIKNLTFKELDDFPNFKNHYIDQCQQSANDRISDKNKKLSYIVNQNNIKKYCNCTYESLVSKKKSIHQLENNIFENIKGCVNKFNKTTKKNINTKNKKKIKLLKKK